MPDFTELFVKTKGQPIQYKKKILLMMDYFPFENEVRLLINIEKTNSEWRQGIGLSIFGFIEIEDIRETVKDRAVFWEDTAPKEITIKIWGDDSKRPQPKRLPKKGLLGIKNIWDPGDGMIDSWRGGAAMIVEEIENGKRYLCNDGHPDENFDDIVFTIRKLKK